MITPRLHITGASCSGVSTLGHALAGHFGIAHLDMDDFYWISTDPPFTTKRLPEDRLRMIGERLPQDGWVLSGSLCGWGDGLMDGIHLIVFVDTPTDIRLDRLTRRETERFGDRLQPGGDMHEIHTAFRDWSAQYDDPGFNGRSRASHRIWLEEQTAPKLHVDGTRPVADLVGEVVGTLSRA